jgi:hypothetical protein
MGPTAKAANMGISLVRAEFTPGSFFLFQMLSSFGATAVNNRRRV